MHSVSPHSNATTIAIVDTIARQFRHCGHSSWHAGKSCDLDMVGMTQCMKLTTLASVYAIMGHPYALIYEPDMLCVTKKYDFRDIDMSI